MGFEARTKGWDVEMKPVSNGDPQNSIFVTNRNSKYQFYLDVIFVNN